MDYTTTPVPYLPRLGHLSFLALDGEELDTSSLQAKLIQSPTREYLLSRRRAWATATRDDIDADTLLADLGQLAPSVAKDFVSKEHTEARFAFRLIKDVDYHGEEEGYIAVSYCWKKTDRDTPRKVVEELPFAWSREIEQFSLPTSSAIFQAVLRERYAGEGLWFDQVCINQDDDAERAATIGATDRIYGNARVVVVALDDVVATPAETQFLQYYLGQYSYSDLPIDQQPNAHQNPPFMCNYPEFVSFLERFLESEWFERAWCTHEMRLGQQHVFLLRCSSQYEHEAQTVLRFTTSFLLHMLILASELATFTPAQQTKMRALQALLLGYDSTRAKDLAVQRPDTPQSPSPEPSQLVSTIVDVFQMKAGGNPQLPEYLRRLDANRDKICIALSAAKLPITLAPANPYQRPSIEDECLRSLLLVGLAARDPVCLCTTGTPLQLHDGSVSWLSRPTSLDTHSTRSIPRRFPRTQNPIRQASDGRAEYIQLDLIFLDLPHRSNPNPLFPTHIARARLFIHLCLHHRIPGPGMWTFWQTGAHPRSASMLNVFIQTLACIFDCGPQWLHDHISSFGSPHSALSPHEIDLLLNPHLLIQNYILLPSAPAALSSLLACLSNILIAGIPWSSNATERTHGPLIVTAPAPSHYPADTTVYGGSGGGSSGGGKAIVFAPFAHSKTLLIAVPDAVKGAEYQGLARAWVLTSMNPYTGTGAGKEEVSWTVQSKGVVFGDGGFRAGVERAEERRWHRVYGPVGRVVS